MLAARPCSPQLPSAVVNAKDERLERRADLCRWLLKVQRMRGGTGLCHLSSEALRALAPNPYHEILLDLYLAELEGRQIYQSYLVGSSPPSTIHRQVARLEALGLVSRTLDLIDQRRLNVALTEPMRRILGEHLDALALVVRQAFPSPP